MPATDLLPTREPPVPAGSRAALASGTGVLALSGPDRIAFLQGLISNDVTAAGPERAVYATLLTAQGRFLHDMMIVGDESDRLLLACEAARRDDLLRRLRMYKLRSKIELADATDSLAVALVTGAGAAAAAGLPAEAGAARPLAGGVAFVDPRLAELGVRVMLPRHDLADSVLGLPLAGDDAGFDALRLAWGIPDGSRDMEPEKALLLENGVDTLDGISWTKGCYIGQELTARTRYRGLVKKRLLPAGVEGALPAPGTPVVAGGQELGEVRSGGGGIALVLLRIAELEQALAAGQPLTAGGAVLHPYRTRLTGPLSKDAAP